MTKEDLREEAVKRVDAFIDTLSQDIRSTLYNRLNQEDVKDFLYGLYIDSAEPRERRINHLEKELQLHITRREAFIELEEENERLRGDLELWESGACKATNIDKCGVVKELKSQIKKLKQDLDNARKNADKQEQWKIYSVLNDIYNDNFEVITSVSN